MIDIKNYRDSETIAKNNLPTWVLAKNYSLEIFEKEGFPVRIDNIQQTRQIFDTMQEHRFDSFMEELNGFTVEDLSIFVDACINNIKFQQLHFPKHKSFIPFDTLMSAFTIYKKINLLKPKAKKILEIGPGTGSLSFFLNSFKKLNEYSYTDACESFYMLQNNINSFLYQNNFIQHILEDDKETYYINQQNKEYTQGSMSDRYFVDNINDGKLKCNAYPWWKLGELNNNDSKYDIVTSNANLLEFSEGALNDYLSIMNNKLKKDGMVFVQCLGYSLLRDNKYLLKKLEEYKLRILFFGNGGVSYKCSETNKDMTQVFTLPNMILVKKEHDLFNNLDNSVISQIKLSNIYEIDSIFLPNYNSTKKKFTKNEIRDIIIKRLANV